MCDIQQNKLGMISSDIATINVTALQSDQPILECRRLRFSHDFSSGCNSKTPPRIDAQQRFHAASGTSWTLWSWCVNHFFTLSHLANHNDNNSELFTFVKITCGLTKLLQKQSMQFFALNCSLYLDEKLTDILRSEQLKWSSFLGHPVIFQTKHRSKVRWGHLQRGRWIQAGYEKFLMFNKCLAISRKWYKKLI